MPDAQPRLPLPATPPPAAPPSARGLAVCLMALAGEAQALPNPFAAHLIAAAAAALLEPEDPAGAAPPPGLSATR